MKILILALFAITAHADEIYWRTVGDTTFGSDGTILKKIGNVYHDINTGIDYTRTEAGLLGSDGSSAIISGNVVHNGDGSTCIRVGQVVECDSN